MLITEPPTTPAHPRWRVRLLECGDRDVPIHATSVDQHYERHDSLKFLVDVSADDIVDYGTELGSVIKLFGTRPHVLGGNAQVAAEESRGVSEDLFLEIVEKAFARSRGDTFAFAPKVNDAFGLDHQVVLFLGDLAIGVVLLEIARGKGALVDGQNRTRG